MTAERDALAVLNELVSLYHGDNFHEGHAAAAWAAARAALAAAPPAAQPAEPGTFDRDPASVPGTFDAAPAQGEPTRHLTSDEQQMLGRALRAGSREVTAQGEPQPVRRFSCFTNEDGVYESPTGEHVAYVDYAARRAENERQAREIAEWKRKYGDANEWGLINAAAWKDRAERAEVKVAVAERIIAAADAMRDKGEADDCFAYDRVRAEWRKP